MGFAGPGIPFHSKRKDSRMKLPRRSALLMSCAAIRLFLIQSACRCSARPPEWMSDRKM